MAAPPSVTVARTGCRIDVTIRVEFANHTSANAQTFRNLVHNWQVHTESLLNGPKGERKWQCCTVRFRAQFAVRGAAARPNHHEVDVNQGPGNGWGQSWTGNPAGPQAGTGVSHNTDWGVVTAHEVGHILGLPDEYHYDGSGKWVNDNPQAGGIQSIMAQTWGAVAFLQTHIDRIMAFLGATCPEDCCPPGHVRERAPRLPRERPARAPAERTLRRTPTPALLELAVGDNALAGRAALGEIRRRAGDAVPELAENVASPDVRIARVAAGLLGEVAEADAAAVTALRAAVRDERIAVRLQAAHGLGRVKLDAALPVLIRGLASADVLTGRPPLRATEFAVAALSDLTGLWLGEDFFDQPAERKRLRAAWEAWRRAR